MLLHDARRDARVDAHGDLVLLGGTRSRTLGPGADRRRLRAGRACAAQWWTDSLRIAGKRSAALHAQAPTAAATDWPQIVLLYRELMKQLPQALWWRRITPPPPRRPPAVAMSRRRRSRIATAGRAGRSHDELQSYQPFFATRAELQRRLGRLDEAVPDYRRGLELAKNEPEKRYMARRLAELSGRIRNAGDT